MANYNPIDLNYLVFDDDPEAEDLFKSKVKINGYNCCPIFINPVVAYNTKKDKFYIDKLEKEIKEKIKRKNISLIVTDWQLLSVENNTKNIVGWDIIECLLNIKPDLKKREFLIYSGDLKDVSRYITNKINGDIKKNESKNEDHLILEDFISEILSLRINFCERNPNKNDRFQMTKKLLENSNMIENIVISSMSKFDQNMIINTGNEYFDNMKISDILKQGKIDIKGLRFIREFIELAIANYSEINIDNDEIC